MGEFDRILNVIDYEFKNEKLLLQAFTKKECKGQTTNEELITIGDELIDKILDNNSSKDKIKEMLFLPCKSFDMLENINCNLDELEETFNSDLIKINIFKAILGAIYLDSGKDFQTVLNTYNAVFSTNISFITKMNEINYIYIIRNFVVESSFDEYCEIYNHYADSCDLVMPFDGIVTADGKTKLEARYYACQKMFDYLIKKGYLSYKK